MKITVGPHGNRPFPELRDALSAIPDGFSLEIWVAEGTYTPVADADRFTSFSLKDGISLYGGFQG